MCYVLCPYTQSAGSFDDMQEVKTGYKTDKGVVRKLFFTYEISFSNCSNAISVYIHVGGQAGSIRSRFEQMASEESQVRVIFSYFQKLVNCPSNSSLSS